MTGLLLRRFSRTPPRPRDGDVEIPPEERDKRTVFCMQLHTRLRARDLEEFFSQVGRVSWGLGCCLVLYNNYYPIIVSVDDKHFFL